TDLLSVDGNRADQLVLLEHRRDEKGTGAASIRKLNEGWFTFNIGLLRPDVGDVNNLPRVSEAPERKLRAGVNDRLTAPPFDMLCRSMHGDGPEPAALAKPHDAELCFADAGCVLQHGLEHGLQVAGRPADDLQHLGSRRLLLQRLGEFLFQVGVGYAKPVNVSSRLRCLRTKTGNASSALRPFASQGHLVGTVTGPPSSRTSQGSSLSILTEPH